MAKLKGKDKVYVLKKLINKEDINGIVICRYLNDELNLRPEILEKYLKNPFSFFIYNPSYLKDIDKLNRIRKILKEEEKIKLREKISEIPSFIKKAVLNPLCREELEIKYGLYNSPEELEELMRKAKKKIGIYSRVKRGMTQ